MERRISPRLLHQEEISPGDQLQTSHFAVC